MGIDGAWCVSHHVWSYGPPTQWSHDVEIPPLNTMAVSSLASLAPDPDGGGSAAAGIIQYRTRDPNSGADTVINIPGQLSPVLEGLTPMIYEPSCDSVTFLCDCEDGGDSGTIAMVNFMLFFWD